MGVRAGAAGVVVVAALVALAGPPVDPAAAGTAGPAATAGPRPAPVVLPPPVGAGAPLPAPAVLARRLHGPLASRDLGRSVAALVADARTGEQLYAAAADAPVMPASTAKLLTAAAVLIRLGPDRSLVTRVVRAGPDRIVLVGGGDPTLTAGDGAGYPAAPRLAVLARRTAAALRAAGRPRPVRVGYDATLYAGPRTAPGWRPSYVSGGDVAPVSALEVDEGRVSPRSRTRSADPPVAAATAFVGLLRRAGVAVAGAPQAVRSRPGERVLATVRSAPAAALVERMLMTSDNDLAEALGRQVALASGRPASFEGAAAAVLATDRAAGLVADGDDVTLLDVSGLSRADRVTAAVLVRVLRAAVAAGRPGLRDLATALPVAGFAGTLADRFSGAATGRAAGDVRAKTGTLDHVSALAGFTVDTDGRLLVFAFLAGRVPGLDPTAAERALDVLAAVVTGCGCR